MPPIAAASAFPRPSALPPQQMTPVRGGLLLVALTLAWDACGADLAVMRTFGGPQGFALRDHWLLSSVLHDDVRRLFSVFYLLVWVWAAWPDRPAGERAGLWTLPRRERVAVALLVGLGLVVVNLVKNTSHTSCPWDLQAFGGTAHYVSHWSLGERDGGGGHCFPGGHASSACAFLALSLPWLLPPAGRSRRAAVGRRWLGFFTLAGLVAGAVQTVRGAHYPSHTLWTLVICGGVSLAGWRVAQRWIK